MEHDLYPKYLRYRCMYRVKMLKVTVPSIFFGTQGWTLDVFVHFSLT